MRMQTTATLFEIGANWGMYLNTVVVLINQKAYLCLTISAEQMSEEGRMKVTFHCVTTTWCWMLRA